MHSAAKLNKGIALSFTWSLQNLFSLFFADDFDEFTCNNDDIILRSIAEDIRHRLPVGAVLNSEHNALHKVGFAIQLSHKCWHMIFN